MSSQRSTSRSRGAPGCTGFLEGYAGPERFSKADPGWRWSYTQNATGLQVTVYPDAMLSQSDPEFTSDQSGQPMVRRTSGAPSVPYPRPLTRS